MAELNPEQREAVFHKEGPLLVLAGAGAGKTRVIVERIAELIRSGVAPQNILAVTFTNKAAAEMRERVEKTLHADNALSRSVPLEAARWAGRPLTGPFIGTFHALSLHVIKTFHKDVGLPARFSISDRSDSLRAIKRALVDAGFDPKQLEPSRVLGIISRRKGDAIDLEEFREKHATSYIDEAVAEVWERYRNTLKKEKSLDFDDILLTAHHLLHRNGVARDHFMDAWEHISVDEYQDTNRVQYEIVRVLGAKRGNLMAVGDHDQNIYTWRGASLSHIMNFEEDFPGAKTVLLTRNYRSTKTILQAANDAIAKNTYRKEKNLTTENADGAPIKVAGLYDEVQESAFVTGECRALIARGTKPEDMAVLYRANFQSRVLEEAFLTAGIPYQVLGTRFFERKEIRDALAYLRIAQNPDSSGDFARIVNVPARGIGKVGLAKILGGAANALPAAQKQKYEAFLASIARIRTQMENMRASEAVKFMLAESGLARAYEAGKGEDEERFANLKELVSVATKYDALPPEEGIQKLIEDAALQSEQDEIGVRRENKPGVKLMTVHAAKGLEFPIIFVTGLEEGLFPYERDEESVEDREEERRLFYVALTRAREQAYLTWALSRRIFGTRMVNMPSEFVNELDPALVELVGNSERAYDEHDDIIL